MAWALGPADDAVTGELAALTRSEREGLLAFLVTLTPEQGATPSLCDGWTVQGVAAHLAFASAPPPLAPAGWPGPGSGEPVDRALCDAMTHGVDIRRPPGSTAPISPAVFPVVADFQFGPDELADPGVPAVHARRR